MLTRQFLLKYCFLFVCRKSRKTIDTTDTVKVFGPVEIHYGKVQQKVTLKYDSWHREILSRFGGLLGENMREFHVVICKVWSAVGIGVVMVIDHVCVV